MSAMPDLRLQAAPEVKSKAKPPASAPEPSKNEPSSFSKLYARERQAQSAERAASADKAESERPRAQGGEPAAADDSAAQQPPLAATGNTLPDEEQPGSEGLDPLLAMALGGQGAALEPPAAGDDVAPLVVTLSAAAAAAQAQTEPEAELETLQMAQLQGESQVEQADTASSKHLRASASTDFATAMAAMGKSAEGKNGTEGANSERPVDELGLEALESLKDSLQPNRPEQFVSKLNALTQALNQQAGATQRLPLAPGQPVAMQQTGWSEAVVDRVMMLSSQNLKSAEIQLDPAELGRLEVRINLSQEQAQVTFASANANVREALEGQMHRLRELFAQQGMNLADANVSDQSMNRGWQGQEQGERGRGGHDAAPAGEDVALAGQQAVRSDGLSSARGLVDYYA